MQLAPPATHGCRRYGGGLSPRPAPDSGRNLDGHDRKRGIQRNTTAYGAGKGLEPCSRAGLVWDGRIFRDAPPLGLDNGSTDTQPASKECLITIEVGDTVKTHGKREASCEERFTIFEPSTGQRNVGKAGHGPTRTVHTVTDVSPMPEGGHVALALAAVRPPPAVRHHARPRGPANLTTTVASGSWRLRQAEDAAVRAECESHGGLRGEDSDGVSCAPLFVPSAMEAAADEYSGFNRRRWNQRWDYAFVRRGPPM